MLGKYFRASVFVIAATAISAPALSQEGVALESSVKVERTVTEDGEVQTVYAEPSGVLPGDRLLFATVYRNGSATAVDDFIVTNPLPPAVRLAEFDQAFEVSVDGGSTFGDLAGLQIVDAELGIRPAEVNDVTHIRWKLSRVEPGAEGRLSYYGIVR